MTATPAFTAAGASPLAALHAQSFVGRFWLTSCEGHWHFTMNGASAEIVWRAANASDHDGSEQRTPRGWLRDGEDWIALRGLEADADGVSFLDVEGRRQSLRYDEIVAA